MQRRRTVGRRRVFFLLCILLLSSRTTGRSTAYICQCCCFASLASFAIQAVVPSLSVISKNRARRVVVLYSNAAAFLVPAWNKRMLIHPTV